MTFIPNSLELLTEQEVVGNVTDVTFPNLDINTDRMYTLYSEVANGQGAGSNYQIFFNGDTTVVNYNSNILSAIGGATNFARFNEPRIVSSVAATPHGFFYGYTDIMFNADFNVARWISMNTIGDDTNMGFVNYAGTYDTAILNITNITIHSTTANAIATGSRFRLYRVSPI
jgi:hypothetical protein